jgi:molybdopterin-guanine dinucleotide biosynthesis protein A
MGGVDKPALVVAGRPMLLRVLAAVGDARPRVVVGGSGDLPPDVLVTREQPPGGGPVAATAAGLALIPTNVPLVALLAADLPLLTARAVETLRAAVGTSATADGVVYRDDAGRQQSLCGVWRVDALRGALGRLGKAEGASMRSLLALLTVESVAWPHEGPPPWFDCDTEDDLRQAEEWTR